jgi:sigma-B regulation protein RsbU (phosphoserine phosphatase)
MVSGSIKKVLIVDDNLLFLKIISQGFTKAGFECTVCESAALAIESLKSDIPDAILSDYEMPEMNGIEFRRYLITHLSLRDIPFVFLSNITDKDLIDEGLQLRAVDYITKGTPVNVIVSKLTNLIDTVQKQRELSQQEIKKAADALNLKSVPNKAPPINFFEISFWHQPFQDVPGGDFIDFIKIDERYSFVVLGDIMGKKWMAWFFTFSFLSYIRAAIRFGILSQDYSTSSILRKVNDVICYDDVLKDILSTLSLLMIDNQTKKIYYAGAGDLPILHYKADTKEMTQLGSSGLLLGLFPEGDYTEMEIELGPKDELFIFTDGMTDFAEDEEKKSDYYSFKNKLHELLNDGQCFEDLKYTLFQQSSSVQVDDCSIINIHKII